MLNIVFEKIFVCKKAPKVLNLPSYILIDVYKTEKATMGHIIKLSFIKFCNILSVFINDSIVFTLKGSS
jgi:hypothetical protein